LGSENALLPKGPFRPTFSVASLWSLEEHGEAAGIEEQMAVQDQENFRNAQAKLEPKEDLGPYMGKWVALRNGKVVASDLSAKGLRSQPEVRPTDAIIPVPRSRAGYFIA
jgi:hypothetical protein